MLEVLNTRWSWYLKSPQTFFFLDKSKISFNKASNKVFHPSIPNKFEEINYNKYKYITINRVNKLS